MSNHQRRERGTISPQTLVIDNNKSALNETCSFMKTFILL